MFLQARLDPGKSAGDLAGDEGFPADRRFVVEEDAVAGEEPVGFAVVHGDPVAIELGHPVGRARVEGRGLGLGGFLHLAVELGRGGLIESGFFLQIQNPDGLQQPEGSQGVGVGGVLRGLEGHHDVALGGQVVDLIRLHFLDDADQVGGIGEVPVVQPEAHLFLVRVGVQVVDPRRVEG